MRRESLLAGAIALVVLSTTVALAGVPGMVEPPDRYERPGRVSIAEVTIAPGQVNGQTATLDVATYLQHSGPPSENVTVVVRAVDAESGMLETTQTVDVGTLEDETEERARTELTVEREGGYRIEVVVYRDGERVTTGARSVSGLESLTPAYAETPLEFHRFDTSQGNVPTVTYSIAEAGNETVTLNVSAYLTNRGDEPAGDLQLVFLARQAESNIVAARTTRRIGTVRPGHTVTPSTRITVPDDYNYYLVAILQKDGVIVDVTQSAANLNPNETITVEPGGRNDTLRVGDFEGEGGERQPGGTTVPEGSDQPGFGPSVALVALALLVIALVATRRHD